MGYSISICIFQSIARGRPLKTFGTLLHVKACLQKRHYTRPIHSIHYSLRCTEYKKTIDDIYYNMALGF